jgi:hypothetical protein
MAGSASLRVDSNMRHFANFGMKRRYFGLMLFLPFFWQSCSNKPQTVQELFPELVFDERSVGKQVEVKATGGNPIIDDLEDGDLNGVKVDGRNWSWSQFDDESNGTQFLTINQESDAPGEGNHVLYLKGGGWEKTGAGVSANLVYKTSPQSYGYYDASIYSGIQFWVKANGLTQLKVFVGTPETTSSEDGGICKSSSPGHFTRSVTVTDTWVQVTIPFEEFLLTRHKHSLGLPSSRLKGIHFSFETKIDYEVWLDDLAFIVK